MICPKCKGTGVREDKHGFTMYCPDCHGTGTVRVEGKPITNEEWLKSLDTEGLVDYLFEVHKGGNSVERQMWIENHKERVKMQFRGWLKQPHNS